jgi:hypothetical protein
VALAVAFVAFLGIGGATLTEGERSDVVVADDGQPVAYGLRWRGGLQTCVTDEAPANCYREPIRTGAIKQPVSTATTAVFVVVGLAILRRADRPAAGGRNHRWATPFGFIALLMGPGSALFHGTLTTWGGFFDQWSMYALLSGIVAIDLASAERVGFHRTFWPALALTGAVYLAAGDAATFVFMAGGIGVGVWALVHWRRLPSQVGRRRDGGRLALAFGLLFGSIVPWLLSNPFAGPPTDVPWHGAWHVLSALFVGGYWRYLESEQPASIEGVTGAGVQP